MTTINAPFSSAQTRADLGYDYVFAAEAMRQELTDRLDALGLGVVPLVGDVAGSGADRVRVTRVGNVGYARRMTDLATEDSTVTASTITTGYDTVVIGLVGLAEEETYQQQILSREKGVLLDALKALAPQSWMATWRYKLCVEGSTFGTAIGSAAADVDRDDFLDLIAEYDETLGSEGMPVLMLAPQSWTKLAQSFGGYAPFQNTAADYEAWVARNGRQDKGVRMGVRVLTTDDIVQSGGGYQNFSFEPGAVGWARASTSPITPSNPQGAIYIDDFGMLVEEIPSTGNRGVRRYEARAWFGIDSLSDQLAVKRRFVDKI